MDPTKPILDLYGDSFYSNINKNQQTISHLYNYYSYNDHNKNKYNSNNSQNYKRKTNEAQLQEKYQELYQAYKDKQSKLSIYEEDQDQLKNQNSKLRHQIDRLHNKNQELNATLLHKNIELQEVYRKLQDQITHGGHSMVRGRANEEAIDKLEDGLREAITSNYQILRESALAELKQFLH